MNQTEDKAKNVPSLGYAFSTFFILLLIPLFTFGISSYKYTCDRIEPSWVAIFIVYSVGTIPGLIIGIRYLREKRLKITFGISYMAACFGLLFVEWLIVAHAVADVCK